MPELSLAERYRPRTFEEVIGQAHAVKLIGRHVQRADPRPLLLTGPSGVGKTTCARIIARALNCKAFLSSGSPCLTCAPCSLFGTGDEAWVYTEVLANVTGSRDNARHINDLANTPSMMPDVAFRVIFIDEVHMLTVPAQETLLHALEKPGIAPFVLATTEPSRVLATFRGRCQRVALRLVPDSALIAHGARVCAEEGIAAEPGALALLATDANGQVRNFLMSLEQCAHDGVLRLEDVAQGLDLSWADVVLRTLIALARGDYGAAKKTLREWTAPPTMKADALRDALVHVAHVGFTPRRDHPEAASAFLLASPTLVDELASTLSVSSGGFGVQPLAYVWGLAEQWSRCAPELRDEGDLDLHLLRAAHALSPCAPTLDDLPSEESVSAPVRRVRRARGSPALAVEETPANAPPPRGVVEQPRAAMLTRVTVWSEYRAATMLPQAFGVWFNARLRMPFGAYDITEPVAASAWLTKLKPKLRLRLKDWIGDTALLHYLQHMELDAAGRPVGWLLLHIPPAHLDAARDWLGTQLSEFPGRELAMWEDGMWRVASGGRPAAFHWSVVRDLWRSLDPALRVRDGRGYVSLKDALGVPPQGPRVAGVLPRSVRRWSSSDELDRPAWARAWNDKFGFVCALTNQAWSALDRGWELDEYEYRRAEAAWRAEEIARIEAQFPPGRDAATDLTRERKVRGFVELLPFDPMKRKRPTPLW